MCTNHASYDANQVVSVRVLSVEPSGIHQSFPSAGKEES